MTIFPSFVCWHFKIDVILFVMLQSAQRNLSLQFSFCFYDIFMYLPLLVQAKWIIYEL